MSAQLKELDVVPLVERLLEKSLAGKLSWEPSADKTAFVTTIGAESTSRSGWWTKKTWTSMAGQ